MVKVSIHFRMGIDMLVELKFVIKGSWYKNNMNGLGEFYWQDGAYYKGKF